MKKKKIVFVIFSILDILLAVFLVLYFFYLRNVNSSSNESINIESKKPFLELTKEDAFEVIRKMEKTNNFIPDDFVSSDVKLHKGEVYLDLLYSSSNFNDLKPDILKTSFSISNDINSSNIDNVTFDFNHNHYVSISVDPDEFMCKYGCYRGIIFDKNYLDIYQQVTPTTYGHDYNDMYVFRNFDYDFVKEAMAILIYASIPSDISSIYEYSFDEYDDSFVYTLHYVSYGNNVIDPEVSPYSINLIEKKFVLDKSNGLLKWQDGYNNGHNNVLKAIPISEKEITRLLRLSLKY